jgi:gluconate 5-dehydrogenase
MSLKQAFDLTGRKAIVTGGSRGLGLQISEALGEMGAELVLCARNSDELAAAIGQLHSAGVRAHGLQTDLSRPESVEPFVASALERLGHCDILVNNAGATWAAPTEDHPLDNWNHVFDVNVTAPFLLARAIGRDSMLPRGYGRILNIASPAGFRGNPKQFRKTIAYNASKGALINFTRALAAEWGPRGITVNCIAPGIFPTQMSGPALERMQAYAAATSPQGRIGDSEDLKGAAVLFCSDAGKHITGQILAVDGGISVV